MGDDKENKLTIGDYPPPDHIIRDLMISMDFKGKESCIIRAPITTEVCTDQGAMQVGVIAALVDLLAGGLSLRILYPDWQATSHLSLHTNGWATTGMVIASGSVLRTGRTTVVFEVDIHEEKDSSSQKKKPIGSAIVICSRIPRRKDTRSSWHSGSTNSIRFGTEKSGLTRPYIDKIGIQVVDAAAGVVKLDKSEYISNSFRSLHGAMIATLADIAGQHAARAAAGNPLVTSDLEIHYISPGKVGPFQTRTKVLRTTSESALVRVEVIDCGGAQAQLVSVAMNTATLYDNFLEKGKIVS